MKSKFSLYLKPGVLGFAIFQIAFFTCMWMSKTVHVLFFEQSGHIENFGLSYSAMAAAGYCSFIVGYFCDTWGVRKTLIWGCVLYAVGLFLRIYPQSSSVALVSGLIAGIGASSALSALRLWMVKLCSSENMALMVGVKTSTSSFGNAIGCILAGLVATLFVSSAGNRIVLISSSIGMLSLALYFSLKKNFEIGDKNHAAIKLPWKNLGNLFSQNKKFALMTTMLGVTTGFYVSFISPYLPLIMKDKGLSLVSIGVSTASFALVRFFVDPLIAHFVERKKEHSLFIFLCAEVVIALATGLMLFQVSKWAFLLFLLMRSIFLGFSTISEEVLWIQKIPRQNLGLFMGLNQSAYFIGDFVGGLGNGYLYKNFGLDVCILVVLVIMFVNAGLFMAFFKKDTDASVVGAVSEGSYS